MALMQLTAYINSSQEEVMDKALTQIGSTYTVKPTDQLDIETPSFIVNYDAALLACNYVYCTEFNRFYWATVRPKPGNEIIIECISDPLMSWKTQILNCMILAMRAESIGKPTQYKDTMLPVYPTKKNITSIVMQHSAALLSNDLDANATNCYLLTVLGGEPEINGGE